MTTDITIRTNGNYVSEGELVISGDHPRTEKVKVGPGTPAEAHFTVPHNSSVSLNISERQATADEVEHAKGAADRAALDHLKK